MVHVAMVVGVFDLVSSRLLGDLFGGGERHLHRWRACLC